MTEVKRYDLKQEGDYSQTEGVMTEVTNGDWVRSEDYDALSEQCEELRQIIQDAKECAKDAYNRLLDA